MPEFEIHVRGEARETYWAEADSEDEARAMFERGELESRYTEVESAEIVNVRQLTGQFS